MESISKDDSGATSGDAQKVSDALFSIYGNKQKIIHDRAMYAPFFYE